MLDILFSIIGIWMFAIAPIIFICNWKSEPVKVKVVKEPEKEKEKEFIDDSDIDECI